MYTFTVLRVAYSGKNSRGKPNAFFSPFHSIVVVHTDCFRFCFRNAIISDHLILSDLCHFYFHNRVLFSSQCVACVGRHVSLPSNWFARSILGATHKRNGRKGPPEMKGEMEDKDGGRDREEKWRDGRRDG